MRSKSFDALEKPLKSRVESQLRLIESVVAVTCHSQSKTWPKALLLLVRQPKLIHGRPLVCDDLYRPAVLSPDLPRHILSLRLL